MAKAAQSGGGFSAGTSGASANPCNRQMRLDVYLRARQMGERHESRLGIICISLMGNRRAT
jgi:hypothetical protein